MHLDPNDCVQFLFLLCIFTKNSYTGIGVKNYFFTIVCIMCEMFVDPDLFTLLDPDAIIMYLERSST